MNLKKISILIAVLSISLLIVSGIAYTILWYIPSTQTVEKGSTSLWGVAGTVDDVKYDTGLIGSGIWIRLDSGSDYFYYDGSRTIHIGDEIYAEYESESYDEGVFTLYSKATYLCPKEERLGYWPSLGVFGIIGVLLSAPLYIKGNDTSKKRREIIKWAKQITNLEHIPNEKDVERNIASLYEEYVELKNRDFSQYNVRIASINSQLDEIDRVIDSYKKAIRGNGLDIDDKNRLDSIMEKKAILERELKENTEELDEEKYRTTKRIKDIEEEARIKTLDTVSKNMI